MDQFDPAHSDLILGLTMGLGVSRVHANSRNFDSRCQQATPDFLVAGWGTRDPSLAGAQPTDCVSLTGCDLSALGLARGKFGCLALAPETQLLGSLATCLSLRYAPSDLPQHIRNNPCKEDEEDYLERQHQAVPFGNQCRGEQPEPDSQCRKDTNGNQGCAGGGHGRTVLSISTRALVLSSHPEGTSSFAHVRI